MKSIKKLYILVLLAVLCFQAAAQDQRLLKTKVADVLALLPASDNEQSKRLFRELLNLGDEGMVMIMNGVVPNGIAEGTSSRYAVSLLTHYVTSAEDKSKIENAYLVALSKATDPEVKAYFISNLKLVGSNESVKPLANYIADKDLFDPAVSALISINTADAKQVLLTSLNTQSPEIQIKLTKALGRFRYQPALESITKNASSDNLILKKASLWSLALIADPGSSSVLLLQAASTGFKNNPSEATNALVEYLHQVSAKGN
ncbi:MAG TPA: HEAT repeat domain-containing protein, partial [Chryseolinea sp.]|nr:HEAT repeat domain-containing protein [Chryseolinea sp.]